MSRRRMAVLVGAVLAAGLAGAAGLVLTSSRAEDLATAPVTAVTTETAEVRRTDVAERRHLTGTLGYAGSYQVLAPGPGTLTRLPAVGQVVRRGQTLYEIDGNPVPLLYGRRPAWRTLEVGMTDGADVQQLETNLQALGHGDELTVDRHFSLATHYAVRRWQQAAKLAVTGSLPLGRVVFLPDAIRIGGHVAGLGAQVQPGALVETGTSDQPAVTMQLSPRQLPTAKVGDPVVVTLPDGASRDGRITHVGTVAASTDTPDGATPGGGGPPTESAVPVTVRMSGEVTGFLDRAQVQVAITVEAHRDVLAVPITALNAVAGGGYQLVVVGGTTTRRVSVRTGLFDEIAGLVEVSGAELAEGQKVRVPRADV